ncbi:hypothetical protein COU57_00790 [Candidatus Pacearchaeota archaeon CG10_big_fil_rev_8_21_14_0_10_32_14]|nr:MAG: hypothetical protein COU57_00790 [Candidatus Pacearchaeota archaeon CG10_big_fil_rev_8_21_14_0_10_32_14]
MKKKKIIKKGLEKKNFPTLKIEKDNDIALDFGMKVFQRFNKMVKSVVLFGSTAKNTTVTGSDIDLIIIIDDVTVAWDQELIAWYREELGKILRVNPYSKNLHINTIKLSTWWEDLLRGDPVVLNVIRYGETVIDFGGFFDPLKGLLLNGKIKSTPEAIYSNLARAPQHFSRSKLAELNAIEGLYWAMVDSAQAALMSSNVFPPSPEHIPIQLSEHLVNAGKLKSKYITYFRDLHYLHKQIVHGERTDLRGIEIDQWQEKTEEFMKVMTDIVKNYVENSADMHELKKR